MGKGAKSMLAVGLMSGTSLDGIDAALCEVSSFGDNTKIEERHFHTFPLPKSVKEKIRACAANIPLEPAELTSLNFELGQLFGEAVLKLCKEAHVESQTLAFVASHGQTIFHQPYATEKYLPSTWQMGESAVIAEMCGCPVVSDFRVMDMAAGGQGAPLVPYSEYILYRDNKQNRALQNIGGIGNMTILPANCQLNDIIAFDTGPGNMMIDTAVSFLFNKDYDEGGVLAAQGKLLPELQNDLMRHPYLAQEIPKTTGREVFGSQFTKEILSRFEQESPYDIVATLTWFTAYCISYHYETFISSRLLLDQLIVGGGGSHNHTLLAFLSQLMPQTEVLIQEDLGYSSDAKEAVAFVILGNETMQRRPSNVASATGARKHVVLGKIQYV